MLRKTLKTLVVVNKSKGGPISIGLLINVPHYLKASLTSEKSESKKSTECVIRIQNYKDLSQEIKHRFFKKDIFGFNPKNFTPHLPEMPDFCFCSIIYDLPNFNDIPKLLIIEIDYILVNLIDNLKTDKEKKKKLYSIIDRYIKDDFEVAISDIGVLSEYIAKEIAKKSMKKEPKDFRAAINHLVNKKMSGRVKINYNYIGSLLWPLYYVRNEKFHPYHKIRFNKDTSDLCFSNLSELIRYLSENKIKF